MKVIEPRSSTNRTRGHELEQRAQTILSPTTVVQVPLLQHVPFWPYRGALSPADKEKTLTFFTHSCMWVQVKNGQVPHYSLTQGVALKVIKENLPSGQSLGSTLDCLLCRDKEVVWQFIGKCFDMPVRGHKSRKTGLLGQGGLRAEACRRAWEWIQHVKIFVSHVNIHQRTSTRKEALNNQVDNNSTRFCQPSFVMASPVLTKWAHERSSLTPTSLSPALC